MCGVFGFVSKKVEHSAQEVLTGLKTLEYRGYDSWGVATVNQEGKSFIKKEVGKIGQAVLDENTNVLLGLGHTRWATHGGVTKANSHPHQSFDGRFILVHNGIVENYLELKAGLQADIQAEKIKFKSETDTEVIAHLLAKNAVKLDFKEALRKTFLSLNGLNAIVVIDTKENTLAAVKSGSPLVVGFTPNTTYFASDAVALLPHTKQVHFFVDGEMLIAGAGKSELFDVNSGKVKKLTTEKLNLDVEVITKGGFDHFTLKEIHEQPQVIRTVLGAFDPKNLSPLKKSDLAFVGCGSAYYAALFAQYLFAKHGFSAGAFSGSEFSHFALHLPQEVTPIFLSQSGETIDLIEQVNILKKKGRKVGAIVNRIGSTLERTADYKQPLLAGPEISVMSTKALMAKLTTLLLLSHDFAGKLPRGKELVQAGLDSLQAVLQENQLDKIERTAKKILTTLEKAKQKSVFVIGRGLDYPIALEAALKAKEASYTHMEAFAGGELKHGVLSLIEPGTICIVVIGDESVASESLSNAIEVKSRGGHIIGISYEDHPAFDEYIAYENAGLSNILPQLAIVQLLGYYLSLGKGLDPDKPRNLAKSVTVK